MQDSRYTHEMPCLARELENQASEDVLRFRLAGLHVGEVEVGDGAVGGLWQRQDMLDDLCTVVGETGMSARSLGLGGEIT